MLSSIPSKTIATHPTNAGLIMLSFPRLSTFSPLSKAIALKLLMFLLYACNNAISKYLSSFSENPLNSWQIICYHYLIAGIILLPYGCMTFATIPRPKNMVLHVMRVVSGSVGLLLLHHAFRYMTLSESVGLNMLSPMLTLAWAYYALSETIDREKIGLLLLAMISYLCLIENQITLTNQFSNPYLLFLPISTVFCFQAHTFLTKRLCLMHEHPFHLTWGIFFFIPALLLPYVLFQQMSFPFLNQWLILSLMAIVAILATIALNQAIQLVDISTLLPLGICKYAIMACFDCFFFHHSPGLTHQIGMALGFACIALLHNRLATYQTSLA
tara:strand:+ start:225 stop:1208 length:984 start_codon:yes stop_codon:yes gene_type:complete